MILNVYSKSKSRNYWTDLSIFINNIHIKDKIILDIFNIKSKAKTRTTDHTTNSTKYFKKKISSLNWESTVWASNVDNFISFAKIRCWPTNVLLMGLG